MSESRENGIAYDSPKLAPVDITLFLPVTDCARVPRFKVFQGDGVQRGTDATVLERARHSIWDPIWG